MLPLARKRRAQTARLIDVSRAVQAFSPVPPWLSRRTHSESEPVARVVGWVRSRRASPGGLAGLTTVASSRFAAAMPRGGRVHTRHATPRGLTELATSAYSRFVAVLAALDVVVGHPA